MIKGIISIALFMALISTHAQAQTAQPQATKPKIDMNVKVPPQVETGRAAYAAAKAKLTPEQAATIDKMIAATKEEHTAIWTERILGLSSAKSCKGHETAEQLAATGRDMFIADRYVQSVILGARHELGMKIAALKTMPPQTALDFFDGEMAFMGTVAQSLGEVAIKMRPAAENCEEGKKILARLFTAPAASSLTVPDRSAVSAIQDPASNRLQACIFGGGAAETPDGVITTSFVFGATEENGRMVARPTYSLKMMKKDGSYAYLKEAYINFGGIDTRAIGMQEKAGEQMFIGMTNTSVIPAIMGQLRTKPLGFGVVDNHTGKKYDVRIDAINPASLDKFVNCAVNLEPRLAGDMKFAGFSPTSDKQTQAAATAPPGPRTVYSVMPISGNMEEPVACALTTIQGQKIGEYELGVTLLMYDQNPKIPNSPLAEIWVMGTKQQGQRVDVTDAAVSVKGLDGKTLDSRSIQTTAIPGQRYTAKLPFAAGKTMYASIFKNGLQADVMMKDAQSPVKLTFPAVEPQVAAAYERCVGNLAFSKGSK